MDLDRERQRSEKILANMISSAKSNVFLEALDNSPRSGLEKDNHSAARPRKFNFLEAGK